MISGSSVQIKFLNQIRVIFFFLHIWPWWSVISLDHLLIYSSRYHICLNLLLNNYLKESSLIIPPNFARASLTYRVDIFWMFVSRWTLKTIRHRCPMEYRCTSNTAGACWSELCGEKPQRPWIYVPYASEYPSLAFFFNISAGCWTILHNVRERNFAVVARRATISDKPAVSVALFSNFPLYRAFKTYYWHNRRFSHSMI